MLHSVLLLISEVEGWFPWTNRLTGKLKVSPYLLHLQLYPHKNGREKPSARGGCRGGWDLHNSEFMKKRGQMLLHPLPQWHPQSALLATGTPSYGFSCLYTVSNSLGRQASPWGRPPDPQLYLLHITLVVLSPQRKSLLSPVAFECVHMYFHGF